MASGTLARKDELHHFIESHHVIGRGSRRVSRSVLRGTTNLPLSEKGARFGGQSLMADITSLRFMPDSLNPRARGECMVYTDRNTCSHQSASLTVAD